MKTNKIESLYKQIVEEWRLESRGKGCINFGPKVSPYPVVLGVLQQVYARDPTVKSLILVDNFSTRKSIIEYLTSTDDEENNKEFNKYIVSKQITIVTEDIMQNWNPNNTFYIGISIGVNGYYKPLYNAIICSTFKLICLTGDSVGKDKLYSLCPLVASSTVKEIERLNQNSPVEETVIGITIDRQEDIELLNKYNEHITQTVQIFGSFDNVLLAKNGDSSCNISATQVCYDIAVKNGWNEHLDMSAEFNKAIDEHYNPVKLHERAELAFDIIRKRNRVVTDYSGKLDAILSICKENLDKKILIINKNAEFAKMVTAYLNSNIDPYCDGKRFYDACYDYHDNIDKAYAINDYGEKILVKSGVHKGEPKMLGAQAQRSLANDYFVRGLCNIISTNNAPDKALYGEIDLCIITSPMCDSIESYKYRLDKLLFNGAPFKAVTLYCYNSNEERIVSNLKSTSYHTIINNDEKNVGFDENLGVIICN